MSKAATRITSSGRHFDGAGEAACLTLACPDRTGIVAAVAGFLADRGANILSSDQWTSDPGSGTFLLRTEVALASGADRGGLVEDFEREVGRLFGMDTCWSFASERRRVALLASRYDHCLLDLLWRFRRGEYGGDVVAVISNHPDLEEDVAQFGIPYHHIPVTPETKPDAERRLLKLLAGGVDLVVLARYMQILSPDFLREVGVPLINIHHSSLPAFVGADPHRRAWERGVKLIGATAHYVTEELDAGPIIEQDVVRISHRHGVADIERLGRDVERVVLARAVRWHLEDRVILHEGRAHVFA